MKPSVHHQPSLVADLFGLWRLPYELAAECALATIELAAQGVTRNHRASAQLPIPEPIVKDDEHNLFA